MNFRLPLSFALSVVLSLGWVACSDDGVPDNPDAAGQDAGGQDARDGGPADQADGADAGWAPRACGEEAPNFTACGGDLTGTWEITSVCPAAPIGLEECPAASLDLAISTPAGVTLAFDGATATIPAGTLDVSMNYTVPFSCVPALMEDEEIESCEAMSGRETGDCTGADVCACALSVEDEHFRALERPYSTAGGKLTLEGEGAGEWVDVPYCVRGDWLLFAYGNTIGDVSLLHVLRRK